MPAWTSRWASSFQGKLSVRVTMEAVEGRSSLPKPKGSAFSGWSRPSRSVISDF
jgi:hypothetical protein